MRITVAMDSFKGSLTAPEACKAVVQGLQRALPHGDFVCIPMADGGEGTVECMAAACNGTVFWESIPDLFGRETSCAYALLNDGSSAVIETSMAAGIASLAPEERDVLRASTYGVGVQIRNALQRGCRRLTIGLGGSATTDGGLGALQALGVVFYDEKGHKIPQGAGGGALSSVVRADASALVKVEDVDILYACDVTNPLYGTNGAAYVYGPQKGADAETVEGLDRGLRSFSRVLAQCFGRDCSHIPGAGAAGGLCGGLLTALGGTVRSGFQILSEGADLESVVASSRLVVTGEGKTDSQTAFGKLPCRMGELGKQYGVPVIVLSGSVLPSAVDLYDHGITALFDTVPVPMELSQAMEHAAEYLENTACNVGRLLGKRIF